MMQRNAMLALLLLILLTVSPRTAQSPTGEEVLERIDRNMYVDQAVSTSTMIIHGRSGTRTITSKSWRKGDDKSLVEYLSPARERGKKMLKLGDKIWTYTPEPNDRIIAISGHLLRQSVMGSDLSYEDITENDRLVEDYRAEVVGSEELGGRTAWVVELEARKEGLTYHSRSRSGKSATRRAAGS